MSDTRRFTLSEVADAPPGIPETLEFELYIEHPSVRVLVSREAMDDHAARLGVRIEDLADKYPEFLRMCQPDYADTAFRKLRMLETVVITSGDVIVT